MTIALHYIFDFSVDRLIWDVSHQCYTHKILTERKDKFDSIRTLGGLSGFTNKFESKYDAFTAGHAGTAISTALGLACGDSISDLVKAKAPEVDEEMRAKLDATMEAMNALYLRARTKESYDQMIGEGNAEGNKVVQNVVDALLDQTKAIEKAVTTLDLKSIDFAGSDSLDTPDKVVTGE